MKKLRLSIIYFILGIQLCFGVNRTYPVSEVTIGAFNTIYNLNVKGFASGSALNIYSPTGNENEDWRINYISAGVYEIENSTTGSFITAGANNVAQIATQANNNTQRWNIVGVTKDFLGEFLYYKIINVGNGKALTYVGSSVTTETFTSSESQLWRLDLDGLEGFGAMCKVNEGVKASTIGGLLGPTVFVSNLTDLRTQLGKSGPLTVVLTANIDCINQGNDIRIDSYKTLIGSFSANTLTDTRLVTNYYGWANPPANPGSPSDNIVIKNLTFPVKGREDVIVLQVYSGKNVWIDHNTFYSTLTKAADEVGKFIWINTSSAGPDKDRNPDFVTLSYNVLRNRYWCVAYGTQNTTISEDRTTVAFNVWDSNVRRTPQIGNGSMHTYNNFNVNNSSSVDNAGYANVIGGDGSFVYAEANRFENFKKESSGYWDQEYVLGSRPFKDVGSYTNKSESGSASVTPYLWSSSTSFPNLNWNPRTNYGYKVLKAYNSSGQYDTKAFNKLYSGSKTSQATFKYITDVDLNSYVQETVPHPVLIKIVRDCNGDINGSATLDQCGVCTGGKTGVVECAGAIEGESFCEADGVFEDKNSGFVGTGYVNLDNAVGTSATWYLVSDASKSVQIGVRYANGAAAARGITVSINGAVQGAISGSPTGDWATWVEEKITVTVTQGSNNIILTSSTSDGAPNIDLITLVDGLSSGGCIIDCQGVMGGTAYLDNCSTCVGVNTGHEPCQQDCAGTWGGSTTTDDCGVCLTSTTIVPCTGSMEAEAICDLDGTIDDDNEGFSGTGFVNTTNAVGSFANWVLQSDIDQNATISFRYANGGTTSRDGVITINGNPAGTLVLAPTGSWATWKYVSVNVNLVKWSNELVITATSADGLANLDLIAFSGNVSERECQIVTTSLLDQVNGETKLFPNPTKGKVNLSKSESWKSLNTYGVELIQGQGTEIDLSEQPSGIYFIQLGESVHSVVKE